MGGHVTVAGAEASLGKSILAAVGESDANIVLPPWAGDIPLTGTRWNLAKN